MASRDAEDREGLRKIRLDPVGELRRGLSVSRDDILEPPLSLGRDFCLHGHLWDVGHRVLHDVKLASLPWHAGQHGLPGGTKAGVIIADDQRHSEHACERRLKSAAPDGRHGQHDRRGHRRPHGSVRHDPGGPAYGGGGLVRAPPPPRPVSSGHERGEPTPLPDDRRYSSEQLGKIRVGSGIDRWNG